MFGLPPFDHQRLRHMNLDQAHLVLRNHFDCDRIHCPRKNQAWTVLTQAKRLVPDSGRSIRGAHL